MKFNVMNILKIAMIYTVIFAVVIAALGTLAVPLIMSIVYSWYWMLLYIGYLLAVLFIAAYIAVNSESEGRAR